MKHIAVFLFLFLGFCSSMPLALMAQQAPRFKHLSLEDGLSQSTVSCMLQDQLGYVWLGTMDGLNRYDGYELQVFWPDRDDPHSIADVSIAFLLEDADGTVYVGQHSNGLSRFDRKMGRFDSFNKVTLGKEALPDDSLISGVFGMDGTLFMGTENGYLLSFDPKSETIRNWDLGKQQSPLDKSIGSMLFDAQGRLWFGTLGKGLYTMIPGSTEATPFETRSGRSIPADMVNALYQDKDGLIWIGTDKGLFRYDLRSDQLRLFAAKPGVPNALQFPDIRAIFEDSEGRFWVGAHGALALFQRNSETFFTISEEPGNPHALRSDKITAVMEGNNGLVWVGCSGGGANIYDPRLQLFEHVGFDPSQPTALNNSHVWCIYEDSMGHIWLGTNGGGINIFDPLTGKIEVLRHDPNNPNSLSNDVVRALIPAKDGTLWIATFGGGLNHYNPRTGVFKRFQKEAEDPNSIGGNLLVSLYLDGLGRLWVGSHQSGLYMLNADGKTFTRYAFDSQDPSSLSSNRVWAITSDRHGDYWVGTIGGLDVIDGQTGEIRHYRHDPEDPGSLSHDTVGSVFYDSKERIWVGTIAGLNRLSEDGTRFRWYRKKDGLPSEYIYSIVEDNQGFLWLGTNNGLIRLDPETDAVRAYFVEDGLQSNEFNVGAGFKGQGGKLFFGGINGLTAFYPEKVTKITELPNVVLTDFLVFNRSVKPSEAENALLNVAVDQLKSLNLNYKHYLVGFEFAALEMRNSERTRYAYKLEGLDSDWIETDASRRFAGYTNLSAGSYLFRVKAATAYGPWNEDAVAVRMEVAPPPWLSWWALSGYLLILGLVAALFMRLQASKLARERAIAQKERRMVDRLRQVDKLKDEFLANTSHELRTPLNGIIGLAESLADGATGRLQEETIKNLDMIANSGKRLASLVDDILDYAQLRDHSLNIRKRPVDIYSLTEVVLALSRPLIGERNLVLANLIDQDLPAVLGDENRLQQVMHNLVGNAVKFTEKGKITVSADLSGEMMAISVTDTGIGIPEEEHARIFDSFQQVSGDTTRIYGGTGLGLALTRQLVSLHGGEIRLESQLGKGSTFTFTVPVTTEAADEMEVGPLLPQPQEADLEAENPATEGEHTFCILIVDDEPINRQVLRNHLSLRNYLTFEAGNGAEALEMVSQNKFDLILLDIMMPRMNGYEVCRKLRATRPIHELPVLFLTARNQVSDLKAGFDAGANDYLTKPISKDELLSRIKTHLDLLDTNRNLEERVAERTRELKQRNRELGETNQEILRTRDQLILQEKMASLGTLTAGIAHEIRNPLTFINGFAEVSRDLSLELRAELKHHLGAIGEAAFQELDATLVDLSQNTGKIREHGRRANQIVQSMIVLAKGEGGERRLVEINNMVHEFVMLAWQSGLANMAGDRNFQLEEQYDPNTGQWEVIPQNLSRAIVNLVTNGIEALETRASTGEEGYHGRLKVWTQRIEDAILVGFWDNGPGITEEVLTQVFTPFFTSKQNKKNVGLGLSLSYEIVVREHGGKIDIASEPGKTEVVIRLPVMSPGRENLESSDA